MTGSPEYIIGLDLGQSRDWTAWVVTQRSNVGGGQPTYAVRHIDRIRNVSYPEIVRHTAVLVSSLLRPIPKPRLTLVADYTGVGRPVADLLVAEKLGVDIELVTITGGDARTKGERGDWRVPKRVLASTVQVGLQTKRLTIERALSFATVLTEEFANFKVKIQLNGHETYGAGDDWREGNHDDLVFALALAVWWGEHQNARGSPTIVHRYINLGDVDDLEREDRSYFRVERKQAERR